jgi:aldose 1-epimerase
MASTGSSVFSMVSVDSKVVSTAPDGASIVEYQLQTNKLTLCCINYGATVLSIRHKAKISDEEGEELTLNYRSFDELLAAQDVPYYGCCVGRVANRIARGQFCLEGQTYQLAVNNGVNHLHGGLVGFDKRVWRSRVLGSAESPDEVAVLFEYTSPDGEEGYPGNVSASVVYRLTIRDEFIIEYKASTDKMTPINLTNHTYWNVSGGLKANMHSHQLHLSCSHYLPVDDTQIPIGEIRSVEGTYFDLRASISDGANQGRLLGDVIPHVDGGGQKGLDHCFVIDDIAEKKISSTKSAALCSTSGDDSIVKLNYAGTLSFKSSMGDGSMRTLSVHTTQPAVQVYTGNFLPPPAATGAISAHSQHGAVCLETQHFPDSINQFPGGHVLSPNEVYYHQSIFRIE